MNKLSIFRWGIRVICLFLLVSFIIYNSGQDILYITSPPAGTSICDLTHFDNGHLQISKHFGYYDLMYEFEDILPNKSNILINFQELQEEGGFGCTSFFAFNNYQYGDYLLERDGDKLKVNGQIIIEDETFNENKIISDLFNIWVVKHKDITIKNEGILKCLDINITYEKRNYYVDLDIENTSVPNDIIHHSCDYDILYLTGKKHIYYDIRTWWLFWFIPLLILIDVFLWRRYKNGKKDNK